MDNPGPIGHTEIQSLPPAGISEVLGLVELLNSKGGREDIYKLSLELKIEFGETLTVIRGAELLGLVHTPGGDVVIEPLGEELTRSRINARKTLLREQVKKLSIFTKLTEFLNGKVDHQANRHQVLGLLADLLPNENCEQTFTTLLNWGRYVELFGYNDNRQTFYLDMGK